MSERKDVEPVGIGGLVGIWATPQEASAPERDELILAIARADGQMWESLDDAPTRGRFMGYPAMADAVLASSWLAAHDELVRADERKRLAEEVGAE